MDLAVITYNIRSGTYNPWGLEGIARVIERCRPELVGLQEINVHRRVTGPVDQPRWLGRRLGMESAFGPSIQFEERHAPDLTGYYGNALLSRFPIRASHVQQLPKPTATDEQRTVLGVQVETPNGLLNAFVTHWAVDREHHATQAEATTVFCQTWRAGPPVILMGDFNAAPDTPEIAAVRAAFADAWELVRAPAERRLSFPSGPRGSTTPSGGSSAIDYVFVSTGLSVERSEVLYDTERTSDHNPVLAWMRA